ncbi:MAG: hypothetical protein A4E73_01187 [Syntrophaceae bacterium PtaU1.Bin231]|nr:MAG: hypothetical protein A4E73_01187 [Syntrophaceae bacterium PtaU1.Bin231]
MPVAAVTAGGSESVIRESRTARSGRRWGLTKAIFRWRRWSLTTATSVTSEPVPAVVGTATSGRSGRRSAPAPLKRMRSSAPSETRMLTALAVSMTEPPPTARIASHPFRRYRPARRWTTARSESGGTSSATAPMPMPPPTTFFTMPVRPAAVTPLSVTTIAVPARSSLRAPGIWSRASWPATIRGRQKNS